MPIKKYFQGHGEEAMASMVLFLANVIVYGGAYWYLWRKRKQRLH